MSKGQFKQAAERGAVTLTPFDIQVLNATAAIDGVYCDADVCEVLGCENEPATRGKVAESLKKLDAAGLLESDREKIRRNFRAAIMEGKPQILEAEGREHKAAEPATMADKYNRATREIYAYTRGGAAIEIEPEPSEAKSYPLGNMAECLDALEACGEDGEIRDAIVRKFRAWTGIPIGGALAPVSHKTADELETFVDNLYDQLGELLGEAQALQHKELYEGIKSARHSIRHEIGFFEF